MTSANSRTGAPNKVAKKSSNTITLAPSTLATEQLIEVRSRRARLKNILLWEACRVFSEAVSLNSRNRSVTRAKRFVMERISNPTPEINATGEMLACKIFCRCSGDKFIATKIIINSAAMRVVEIRVQSV